jgi:hypothetical protein
MDDFLFMIGTSVNTPGVAPWNIPVLQSVGNVAVRLTYCLCRSPHVQNLFNHSLKGKIAEIKQVAAF